MAEFVGSAASQADFIWKNAEDLWGDFKHTDFGKVILPFTLLRRLECALEPTRQDVRDAFNTYKDSEIELDLFYLNSTGRHVRIGISFFWSRLSFKFVVDIKHGSVSV